MLFLREAASLFTNTGLPDPRCSDSGLSSPTDSLLPRFSKIFQLQQNLETMESRQDPLTRKICTSKSDLVDTHANLAIRLTMKRINLPPSATDFFHHGADDCINKLNSYFDQMKGGARVQLDKNKGEKQLPIREIVPDLANTS